MGNPALVLVLDPSTGRQHLMPRNLRAVRMGELKIVGENTDQDGDPVTETSDESSTELPDSDPETTTEQPPKTAGKPGTDHKE